MTPRHTRRVDEQLELRIAAEHVLTLLQTCAAVGPAQPETNARVRSPALLGNGGGRFSQCVTESRDGFYEWGICRIVTERGTNLGDEIDEVFSTTNGCQRRS